MSEKEIANVTVERFAVGGVAKGDFILVKLAGKRIISYFIAEVMILVDMNVKSGIKNGWRTPINISLTKKKEYFSILCSDVMETSNPYTSRNVQMPSITTVFFS